MPRVKETGSANKAGSPHEAVAIARQKIQEAAAKKQAVAQAALPAFAKSAAEKKVAAAPAAPKAAGARQPSPAPVAAKGITAKDLAEVTKVLVDGRSALKNLLAVYERIRDEQWPIYNEENDGHLVEQIKTYLELVDVTEGTFDATIATFIKDLDAVIADFSPGKEQGDWAKSVFAAESNGKAAKPEAKAASKAATAPVEEEVDEDEDEDEEDDAEDDEEDEDIDDELENDDDEEDDEEESDDDDDEIEGDDEDEFLDD
jgi:hypothetical protein